MSNETLDPTTLDGSCRVLTGIARDILQERRRTMPDPSVEPTSQEIFHAAVSACQVAAVSVDPVRQMAARRRREHDVEFAAAHPEYRDRSAMAELIAATLDERAAYQAHIAEEERQRVIDMSDTNPALGRYGQPGTMDGKFQPVRDNRDDEPVRSKYR